MTPLALEVIHQCAGCHEPIDGDPVEVVMNAKPLRIARFCNNACKSEAMWRATPAAKKAAVAQLLGALHILSELKLDDLESVNRFDCDYVSVTIPRTERRLWLDLEEFLAYANAFRDQLSPVGEEVSWTLEPMELANELRERLGGNHGS